MALITTLNNGVWETAPTTYSWGTVPTTYSDISDLNEIAITYSDGTQTIDAHVTGDSSMSRLIRVLMHYMLNKHSDTVAYINNYLGDIVECLQSWTDLDLTSTELDTQNLPDLNAATHTHILNIEKAILKRSIINNYGSFLVNLLGLIDELISTEGDIVTTNYISDSGSMTGAGAIALANIIQVFLNKYNPQEINDSKPNIKNTVLNELLTYFATQNAHADSEEITRYADLINYLYTTYGYGASEETEASNKRAFTDALTEIQMNDWVTEEVPLKRSGEDAGPNDTLLANFIDSVRTEDTENSFSNISTLLCKYFLNDDTITANNDTKTLYDGPGSFPVEEGATPEDRVGIQNNLIPNIQVISNGLLLDLRDNFIRLYNMKMETPADLEAQLAEIYENYAENFADTNAFIEWLEGQIQGLNDNSEGGSITPITPIVRPISEAAESTMSDIDWEDMFANQPSVEPSNIDEA